VKKKLFFFRRFLGVLKQLMPFTSGAGGYNGLISQMLRKTPLLTVYQWINLRGNYGKLAGNHGFCPPSPAISSGLPADFPLNHPGSL
jgi:hypothetical protein